MPVDLVMEEEVGGEPPRACGIDATAMVADHELARRRSAVMVEYFERNLNGGATLEQDWDFAPKAEILCALADIERERCFAFTGIATVDLHEPILELETAEFRYERLLVKQLDVQPPIFHVASRNGRFRFGGGCRADMERGGVGARDL